MSRPMVLVGVWPRRMNADLAAAYCGEPNAKAFLKRVGSEYPKPRISEGGRRLWLRDDLDQDPTARPPAGPGRRRGSVAVVRPLPRFVRTKILANGRMGFYWDLTGYYRRLGCSIPCEPLGTDYVLACGTDGNGGRAAALNALFDEWRHVSAGGVVEGLARFGTVDWLFREYKQTKAYLEKVSGRSRLGYERTMLLVVDLATRKGDRVGDRKVKAITPISADKIYELIVAGPRGPRPRQGEKVVGLCARAWSVVHRLFLRRSTEIFRTPGAA
jgi:hypothetical protein